MKKTNFDETDNSDDDLLPEYNFSEMKAKPNRFAVSEVRLNERNKNGLA